MAQLVATLPDGKIVEGKAIQPASFLRTLTFDPDAMPIWKLAAQLSSQVSDEDWEQLPTDLAKRLDDYQKQRQGRE